MKKIFFFIFLCAAITQAQISNNTGNNTDQLMNYGAISVTIGGDFIINGTFPALITDRVDQFITRMFNQAKENALRNINDPELLQVINKKIEDYSLRNIILRRASGEELKIDLQKFRVNGDFKNNPYLKNDDVIIFQPADLERNFFTISGAVNNPGKFSFVEGDKLSDAIELAQGINKAYQAVDSAEISRLSLDGNTLTKIKINIKDNIQLKRGDRIRVLAKEIERKEYTVTVVGEVNLPGKIPITKNSTTLKEVIEAAGGFKKTAALNRARLFTGKAFSLLLEKQYGIKLEENFNLLELKLPNELLKLEDIIMGRMSNLTVDDTAYFFAENKLRILNESGVINFSNLDDDSSFASKYIVRNNDVIIIPQKTNQVYVFGQVVHTGYVPYEPGKDFRYYIKEAGGYGEFAEDENEVMVIKGLSKNWISPTEKNVTIEDGDYIWVPKTPQRTFNYYVREVSVYLSVVASLATIALLIIQLGK